MAKAERRSKNVTVIASEILPVEILANPPADDPEKLTLDLKRTKKYISNVMLQRPTGEVWKEINEQMVAILLFLREGMFKWLEIWTNHPDKATRDDAKQNFAFAQKMSGEIAEQRQVIAKAIGLNLTGEIGEEERETLPALYEPKPMSKEDFERQFLPLIPKPALLDTREVKN